MHLNALEEFSRNEILKKKKFPDVQFMIVDRRDVLKNKHYWSEFKTLEDTSFKATYNTVVVFGDLCAESKKIQKRYFISGPHSNIFHIDLIY